MMNDVPLPALTNHYNSHAERLADAWVHLAGVSIAIIGGGVLFALALWQGGFVQAGVLSIYAICLIAMLSLSAAYNLVRTMAAHNILRRLDHAAIFLMIAGSYTPFTVLRFDGVWALGMTIAVWTLALAGAFGKLFLPGLSKKIWVALYLVLGWLVLIALRPMIDTVPRAGLILLAIGGAIYTLGVVIYVWEKIPFRRAIWHGFVLAAAGVHYAAIVTGVVFA